MGRDVRGKALYFEGSQKGTQVSQSFLCQPTVVKNTKSELVIFNILINILFKSVSILWQNKIIPFTH